MCTVCDHQLSIVTELKCLQRGGEGNIIPPTKPKEEETKAPVADAPTKKKSSIAEKFKALVAKVKSKSKKKSAAPAAEPAAETTPAA